MTLLIKTSLFISLIEESVKAATLFFCANESVFFLKTGALKHLKAIKVGHTNMLNYGTNTHKNRFFLRIYPIVIRESLTRRPRFGLLEGARGRSVAMSAPYCDSASAVTLSSLS